MRLLTSLFSLLCVILLLQWQQEKKSSETSTTDAEVAEKIDLIWTEYIEYANNNDLDGCLSMMTEDYINMQAANSTQYGIEETKEFLESWLETNASEITAYEQIELFVHDDMAYEFCYVEQKVTPDGGESVNVKSRGLAVYKEVQDGEWKFHRWMVQL